tara:strand:+ start:381 stop:485 length:105 start_codon:yes stop_codon:yes gene_type:complete
MNKKLLIGIGIVVAGGMAFLTYKIIKKKKEQENK